MSILNDDFERETVLGDFWAGQVVTGDGSLAITTVDPNRGAKSLLCTCPSASAVSALVYRAISPSSGVVDLALFFKIELDDLSTGTGHIELCRIRDNVIKKNLSIDVYRGPQSDWRLRVNSVGSTISYGVIEGQRHQLKVSTSGWETGTVAVTLSLDGLDVVNTSAVLHTSALTPDQVWAGAVYVADTVPRPVRVRIDDVQIGLDETLSNRASVWTSHAIPHAADEVGIGCMTAVDSTVTLEYGLTTGYGTTLDAAATDGLYHEFLVEGLDAATAYHYRLKVVNNADQADVQYTADCQFTTDPSDADTLVLVTNDLQDITSRYSGIRYAQLQDADLTLVPGDLSDIYVAADDPARWSSVGRNMVTLMGLLRKGLVGIALGNHDGQAWNDYEFTYFKDRLAVDTALEDYHAYSFDYGYAHYAILSMPGNILTDEQLAWLDADLAAATRPWKIVVGHFAAYYWPATKAIPGRVALQDVLTRNAVNLYLAAHIHHHCRYSTGGVLAITSPTSSADVTSGLADPWVNVGEDGYGPKWGTIPKSIQLGGYITLEVKRHEMLVRAYSGADNNIFDMFRLLPLPRSVVVRT